MLFFIRNAIFDQKKAPAATGQQEENGFDQKKRRLRQRASRREKVLTKIDIFHEKKRRLRQRASRRKIVFFLKNVILAKISFLVKNVKIGIKRVAVGAFWTSPGPKCTEKQDLQPRNGDIAPKPLK